MWRSAGEIDRNAVGCSHDWNNGMAVSYVATFIYTAYKIFDVKICNPIVRS